MSATPIKAAYKQQRGWNTRIIGYGNTFSRYFKSSGYGVKHFLCDSICGGGFSIQHFKTLYKRGVAAN